MVIAIIATLLAILLPGLGSARQQAKSIAGGSRLQQLGVALNMYLSDFDRTLPQKKGPHPKGGDVIIGALFGGKKGQLPFYGINEIGAERRPLNGYVSEQAVPPDDSDQNVEMEAFESPADRGSENTGVPIPGFERTDSMYDLIGSSFTLNDHSLGGEELATLVPLGGGKMPYVLDTTKTWVLASHPIYNYQQGGDRQMRWYDDRSTKANMLFLDMHVRTGVSVPEGIVDTTEDYTFLPTPDWLE